MLSQPNNLGSRYSAATVLQRVRYFRKKSTAARLLVASGIRPNQIWLRDFGLSPAPKGPQRAKGAQPDLMLPRSAGAGRRARPAEKDAPTAWGTSPSIVVPSSTLLSRRDVRAVVGRRVLDDGQAQARAAHVAAAALVHAVEALEDLVLGLRRDADTPCRSRAGRAARPAGAPTRRRARPGGCSGWRSRRGCSRARRAGARCP